MSGRIKDYYGHKFGKLVACGFVQPFTEGGFDLEIGGEPAKYQPAESAGIG